MSETFTESGVRHTAWKLTATVIISLLFIGVTTDFSESAELSDSPRAAVSTGLLEGYTDEDVNVFLGVPYAHPPVGPLRWKAPQPADSWEGIKEAKAFGPACPQKFNLLFADSGEQSEDCLYLNVWTPQDRSGSLPVLVYLHGGAFHYGSASQSVYDGSELARHGIVVVTINYRLGLLGFLAHPELSEEAPYGSSGNYGILDQLQALNWVQQNIHAFGGDPENVTLMGESAGAVSVCTLLSSPLADGLFHKAIVMSGGAPDRLRDLREQRRGMHSMHEMGEQWAQRILDRLGLDEFSQLRDVPWKELQGSTGLELIRTEFDIISMMSMDDSICIDGYLLHDSPAAILRLGEQQQVPVIAGSLENEGGMFTMGLRFRNLSHYEQMLSTIFGSRLDLAGHLYPARDTEMALKQLTTFVSDGFGAGARSLVQEMSVVTPDCWLYRFDYESPAAQLSGLGTFHGSELPYVFGSFPVPLAYGRGSRLMSDRLMDYLVSFMKNGNPNREGYFEWPRYDPKDEQMLHINLPFSSGPVSRTEQFDLITEAGLW